MEVQQLIQDVNLRFDELYKTGDALHELGYNFSPIGVIPFQDNITQLESVIHPDSLYVFRGTTKLLTILENAQCVKDICPEIIDEYDTDDILQRLKNGVFYEYEKFDQKYYDDVGLKLVNNNSTFYKIDKNLDRTFSENKFIKPSSDRKAFVGGILEKGQTIHDFIMSKQYIEYYIDEYALISDVREILTEYRFFVVDGKAITASIYKDNGIVQASPDVSIEAYDFVNECISIYEPHDIYTIDVAKMGDGSFNVVEYNCWNISGAYDCDLIKAYTAINEYIINKHTEDK